MDVSTKNNCRIPDGDQEPAIIRLLHIIELILVYGLKSQTSSLTNFLSFSRSKPESASPDKRKTADLPEPTAIQNLSKKSFWPVVSFLVKNDDDVSCSHHLSKIEAIKCRILLRLLLMKKQTHDFILRIKHLYPEFLGEKFYDVEHSILTQEDAFGEFTGLLLSMNGIDVDFCLKNPDVDILQASSLIWSINPTYLLVDLDDSNKSLLGGF